MKLERPSISTYKSRPRFNGIGWKDGKPKWHTFGSVLKFGPDVYKVCRTKWGARRLARRYNKNRKVIDDG